MTDGTHERDPWTVLGLPATASVTQATHAHRRLAERHHPDRTGADPAEQAVAARRTAELTAAIDAIRDGARPTSPQAGWWQGRDPDEDTDGRGAAMAADERSEATSSGVSRSAREPVPCPLCGDPFERAGDLRAHLASAHPHLAPRPHRPLLDRLDTIAWRLPGRFLVVLGTLVAVVASAWAATALLPGGRQQHALDGSPPRWLAPVVAAVTIGVAGAVELLQARHRRRVERSATWDRIRRGLP